MTLEPRNNKYVQYFEHIRQIQGYIRSRADFFDVPKIDNTNIDRSLAKIHASVFKSVKKVALNKESLFDLETNKANIARTYTKPIWNSSHMLTAIRTKRSSLELSVSQIGLPMLNSNNRRLALHKRSSSKQQKSDENDDSDDTDSDESTRTDDGGIIRVVDHVNRKDNDNDDDAEDGNHEDESNNSSNDDADSNAPLRFTPKLTKIDRGHHRRLLRHRRKQLHFSASADSVVNRLSNHLNNGDDDDDDGSSDSDQERQGTPQMSDTDLVGSLSEFSDSLTDVRHIDFFDAS